MANIGIIIQQYKSEKPNQFWNIVKIISLLSLFGVWVGWQTYLDKHTPKLEIIETKFYYEPFPGGNVTGIMIAVANQSDAWAKDVKIDFINDNGYSKYERNKYYESNNKIIAPKEIRPNGVILDGYLPQGAASSPTIYQNNEKQYKVDVFISWESDKGKKYYLISGYELLVDKFSKGVNFKRVYRYDTFKDKRKIGEIKKANSAYLSEEMK